MQLTPIDPDKIANAKQWLAEFQVGCIAEDWGANIDWEMLYVSGGAIASALQGEVPKDVDIYCTDAVYAQRLKNELTAKYYEHIAEATHYREYYDANGKMVTEWAITMKNKASCVFRNSGEPKVIKASFDYVHTTPHFWFRTDATTWQLYISPLAYHCAVNKILIVNNPKSVTQTRIEKFKARGYREL